MQFPNLSTAYLSSLQQAHTPYPEKVLQFGTGALLRGLTDYIIHQSNEAGEFGGSIVAVGSTGSGRTQLLNEQGGLFTHWIEGVEDDKEVGYAVLNQAISRALSAKTQWAEVLAVARHADLQLIISNTTEVGIQYLEESIFQHPPTSFPAKLTAVLYERMQHQPSKPLVILPTELILHNGDTLKEIILQHAAHAQLGAEFRAYIHEQVVFCNTLVDRIVTGTPDPAKHSWLSEALGYYDRLLTVSETYFLWAIEGDPALAASLPFSQSMPQVILSQDITPYRERKLRLLNGTHTISVALGHLCGLSTIYDCMQDSDMSRYIRQVMQDEIVPSLPDDIPEADAFAQDVLDRFSNPSLDHHLLDIAFQYTSKMAARNVPTILRYMEKKGDPPKLIALGFAAYLHFLRPKQQADQTYLGTWANQSYKITDQHAGWWEEQWKTFQAEQVGSWLNRVLGAVEIWGEDLSVHATWVARVQDYVEQIQRQGANETLAQVLASTRT